MSEEKDWGFNPRKVLLPEPNTYALWFDKLADYYESIGLSSTDDPYAYVRSDGSHTSASKSRLLR